MAGDEVAVETHSLVLDAHAGGEATLCKANAVQRDLEVESALALVELETATKHGLSDGVEREDERSVGDEPRRRSGTPRRWCSRQWT